MKLSKLFAVLFGFCLLGNNLSVIAGDQGQDYLVSDSDADEPFSDADEPMVPADGRLANQNMHAMDQDEDEDGVQNRMMPVAHADADEDGDDMPIAGDRNFGEQD